ncbi:MAG: hypothetical protein FWG24_06915 [Eggerthellaceae bacterium]|nr:hypothetical protein [Eggerthellaceae bacterium]MDR2721241.1 hypothetical protein [Coriobacteriaceae bacterium]
MGTPTVDTVINNLKTNDYSDKIREANTKMPQLCDNFVKSLNDSQRKAVDKVFPVGGSKKIYAQLVGMPTPPVMLKLAQPASFDVVAESGLSGATGIKLNADDVKMLLTNSSDIPAALKSLKGQGVAVLSLLATFAPILTLGGADRNDLFAKAGKHFAPIGQLFS